MKKKTLRRIIYPRVALIMLSVLLLFTFFSGFTAKKYIYRQSQDNLQEVSSIIEQYILKQDISDLSVLQQTLNDFTEDSRTRITIIRKDGLVVVDSEKDPSLLNNHANRPEIFRAFQGIPSSEIRKSPTLNIDMLYYAKQISDAYVLRLAMPYTELSSAYRMLYLYIAIGALIFIGMSFLLFYYLDTKIERPLAQLAATAQQFADLKFELDSFPPSEADEVQKVFSSMRNMALRIEEQFIDVRHRKESLQAVLDGMREAVLVINSTGNIITTNPAAQQSFSSCTSDSLIGSFYLQVLRSSELSEIIEPTLEDPSEPLNPSEKTIVLNDRYFQVHLSKIGIDEHTDIMLVLNDITTLMHLEQVRKDFVANVSHELKTPVTSIKGFTETLLYSDLSKDQEKSRRFLTIINNQSDRLQAIIDDLLMLSRLEQAHDRSIDFVDIDILRLIQGSVQICKERPSNENRVISIECSCTSSIRGNSLLIEQALINLIDNALKYSDEHKPVNVLCTEDEHNVILKVRDRGYGIPPAALDRIFERFYRVDKGRSRDKGGTGLGLSIVKHIVMQHHGTISVSSSEGEGSSFTVTLPKHPQL